MIEKPLPLQIIEYYVRGDYYLLVSYSLSMLSIHCRYLDSRTQYDSNLSQPFIKNHDHLIASALIEIAHPDKWHEVDDFFDSVHAHIAKDIS